MPSKQSRVPFWLCTCASLIFLVAAGYSPSLGAGSPANLDCGKDVGCFVKAFDEGKPATVRQVTSINMSGMTDTIGTYWETRAFRREKCSLYIRVEAVKCSVDETAIRQTQASMGLNLSKEAQETALKEAVKQMEPMVEQMNQESVHRVGHDATCVFQTAKLKTLIAQWQKGELVEAWSKKAENCQGSLLGQDEGSVSLASSVHVSAAPPSAPAPEAPPPPSETQVTANYDDGPAVQFKPEEKRAFLFMAAIVEVEKVCQPDGQGIPAQGFGNVYRALPGSTRGEGLRGRSDHRRRFCQSLDGQSHSAALRPGRIL